MRRLDSSHRNFAAIVALAIALGPLLGCTCSCPKVVGAGGAEQVNVEVTWNSAGRTISVAPDPVRLCEGRQFPVWILVGAPEGSTLEISFRSGSPFPEDPAVRTMAKAVSGPEVKRFVVKKGAPQKGTAGKSFKYDVSVTLPDGFTKTLDPRVEIWP